jgi:hypothetical protein
MVPWAIEPAMSCLQSRQSNEMDSVNRATFAAGPSEKRPLRETGTVFCLDFTRIQRAGLALKSHVSNQNADLRRHYLSFLPDTR